MTTDITKCVHCGKCRDNCAFLQKYNIDIGDGAKLKELAYHCFLCGKCSEVCPAGIDGRAVVEGFRREMVMSGKTDLSGSGYRMLLWEKKNYKFRNYRHAGSRSVLFPGCNFPSMYPKTTAVLVKLLGKEAGMGVVYDCCGKPVAELGLSEDEAKITAGINARLRKAGAEEIVVVCPNCYYYLKDRLEVKVISIYDRLHELGLGSRVPGGDKVFMPCPDRSNGVMLKEIEKYFAENPYVREERAQCCGLGGSAGVHEPEIAGSMTAHLADNEGLCVYCASCAGKLTRDGAAGVRHILTEILGTYEKPDTGKSMVNRVLTRFR